MLVVLPLRAWKPPLLSTHRALISSEGFKSSTKTHKCSGTAQTTWEWGSHGAWGPLNQGHASGPCPQAEGVLVTVAPYPLAASKPGAHTQLPATLVSSSMKQVRVRQFVARPGGQMTKDTQSLRHAGGRQAEAVGASSQGCHHLPAFRGHSPSFASRDIVCHFPEASPPSGAGCLGSQQGGWGLGAVSASEGLTATCRHSTLAGRGTCGCRTRLRSVRSAQRQQGAPRCDSARSSGRCGSLTCLGHNLSAHDGREMSSLTI